MTQVVGPKDEEDTRKKGKTAELKIKIINADTRTCVCVIALTLTLSLLQVKQVFWYDTKHLPPFIGGKWGYQKLCDLLF